MLEFFKNIFDSAGFISQGDSYGWQEEVLWPMVTGNILTALAFLPLPFILFSIIRKDLLHHRAFVFLTIFLLFCISTLFLEVYTVWNPIFRLSAFTHLFMGIFALLSTYGLHKTIPALMQIPTNDQLAEANNALLHQVAEKENAQAALRQANDELENQVQKRSAQLIKANRELEKEIEIRKKTERDLINKNGELIRINGDLDNFVYCASHDLKSPVVNAEGLVSALREELGDKDQSVKDLISRLEKSVQQMHVTIQDLTEVSSLQRTTDASDYKLLSFTQVLEEVKIDLADNITKINAQVTADFSVTDQLYFTHKNLKSLIYNLVSNALKYHAPDRLPRVELKTGEKESHVFIAVTDNGIGIDLPRHEKKIFSLFKRLHDDKIEGSGVGLFIVKRIMEYNQGRVEVESTPGEGTTFRLIFPKRKAPVTPKA